MGSSSTFVLFSRFQLPANTRMVATKKAAVMAAQIIGGTGQFYMVA